MKVHSQDIRTVDELELAVETLKDLTPSPTTSDQVRGGPTLPVRRCYCGSM